MAKRIFTDKEKEKACALYARGLTIEDLCDIFDTSEHVLKREVGKRELRKAKKHASAALVNRAYKLAMQGDKTMLIFLIKTQCKWSEQFHEMDYKMEIEKQILKYKQEIGFTEYTSAPIEIHLNTPERTRDYDRNTIETDSESIGTPLMGVDAFSRSEE